jgi:hypothetical protein
MPEKDEKKERVIHTRISESLEQELKERAASLGVSVSNLVRNVLSNTFGLVEDIVADSANVARSARAARGGRATGAPDSATGAAAGAVIGWQTAVLEVNALCSRCNAILPRGTEAALGITDAPGPKPALCASCLEEVRHGRQPDSDR